MPLIKKTDWFTIHGETDGNVTLLTRTTFGGYGGDTIVNLLVETEKVRLSKGMNGRGFYSPIRSFPFSNGQYDFNLTGHKTAKTALGIVKRTLASNRYDHTEDLTVKILGNDEQGWVIVVVA